MNVDDGSISIPVEGSTFTMQLRPLFEEGSSAQARFTAYAQQGKLVSLGDFSFLPISLSGVLVQAMAVQSGAGDFAIEVDWKDRSAAKQIALERGASYREKSFIAIPQNATQDSLDSAVSAGKGYVTFASPGVLGVRNDFADSEKANADLSATGLELSFPPSEASFANQSGEQGLQALQTLLDAFSSAGINAAIVESSVSRARLPDRLDHEGTVFYTGGREVEFSGTGSGQPGENGTVLLELSFEAVGSSVSRIISAKEAAPAQAESG